MAKNGLSVPEIAEKLNGPTQKTIREWLVKRKVNPEPGRRRWFDREQILRDLEATTKDGELRYTRRELCEKYGCSAKFLSQLARGAIHP